MNIRSLGTPVEIIDFVTVHLLKQGKRAVTDDGNNFCRYRLGELSCAVGCLLSDEDYTPKFENKGALGVLSLLGIAVDDEVSTILTRLQEIHDCSHPDYWKDNLASLRQHYVNMEKEDAE